MDMLIAELGKWNQAKSLNKTVYWLGLSFEEGDYTMSIPAFSPAPFPGGGMPGLPGLGKYMPSSIGVIRESQESYLFFTKTELSDLLDSGYMSKLATRFVEGEGALNLVTVSQSGSPLRSPVDGLQRLRGGIRSGLMIDYLFEMARFHAIASLRLNAGMGFLTYGDFLKFAKSRGKLDRIKGILGLNADNFAKGFLLNGCYVMQKLFDQFDCMNFIQQYPLTNFLIEIKSVSHPLSELFDGVTPAANVLILRFQEFVDMVCQSEKKR